MEPKRSKYDTNPLDDSVADRAGQSWGRSPGTPTEEVSGGPTQEIGSIANPTAGRAMESEAPTRRIDDQGATSYPSIFVPPAPRPAPTYQPPRVAPENIYQPPPAPPGIYQPPPNPALQWIHSTRKVEGLGISEKWGSILPYCPFYIGLIASIVELLLVPRTETRTRFHAAQGLALHLAFLIIAAGFSLIGVITDSSAGSSLFGTAATVFLIVSMIRVSKGKPHHIAPLADVTKWFNEKIIRR